MESISPDDLALELLNQCLRGNDYSVELLHTLLRLALDERAAVARSASHALFRTVVERLGDLFEPCLCDCYAALFAETIAFAIPTLDKHELLERFRRVRLSRPFEETRPVERVFVLSRVTLGADVAVTSRFLDAAKRRFPEAEVCFVGPQKNYRLFAADPRIRHCPSPYLREGTLADRLAIFAPLRQMLWQPEAIVLDTDSRLTQLGLLPVCPEENYYFFESRAYGEYGEESLGELAQRWLEETLGVRGAGAYIAPRETAGTAGITVSLGVGENPAKRVADPFERNLIELLASRGKAVLVDRGGSEDEGQRVDQAVEGLAGVRTFNGSFAAFASSIAGSKLYCGYDSSGQHVAAACGVPLLTVFAGAPSTRFQARWRPDGRGARELILADELSGDQLMEAVRDKLWSLGC